MEKLDFLINYLLKENQEIRVNKIPTNIDDKKNVYRSLCNIRKAKSISSKFLKVEDEYLQEELKTKQMIKNADYILIGAGAGLDNKYRNENRYTSILFQTSTLYGKDIEPVVPNKVKRNAPNIRLPTEEEQSILRNYPVPTSKIID